MTNDNIIEIKKQKKNWLLNGFIFLFSMLISLFVALFPLINEFAKNNQGLFLIIGLAAFAVFTTLYAFNLYTVCKPANALILSARGFIDRINVGDDIEIEWTNVSAVKMLGKSNMPFLGVTLENADFILSKMSNSAAAEMRENIDQNLPTILIPQSKVRFPIKDLKDMFAKFAREARALEKDSQQKQKHNPFTTDDVLRAFGKLPKEEPEAIEGSEIDNLSTEPVDIEEGLFIEPSDEYNENSGDITVVEGNVEKDNIAEEIEANNNYYDDSEAIEDEESMDGDIDDESDEEDENTDDIDAISLFNNNSIIADSNLFEVPKEIQRDNNVPNVNKQSASDSFYEALRSKASAKATLQGNEDQPVPSDDASTGEEIADEINEILSRAKSSRISEIEKILCESDIPYSLSREENGQAKNNGSKKENSVDISLDNIEVFAQQDEVDIQPSLYPVFDDDKSDESDGINIDLGFVSEDDVEPTDDTIQNQSDEASENLYNNLSDTKEFIS